MMTMKRVLSVSAGMLVSLALGACSTSNVLPDKKVEYKRAKQADSSLEIPPDLTRDGLADGGVTFGSSGVVTTYSEYQSGKQAGAGGSYGRNVLPENAQVEIRRDGDKRWLVVTGSPDAVWDKVLDFWFDAGIILVEQDPIAGVMKTDWIENRANIKSDFITDFLRKSIDSVYSSGTRDQYRTRLERGAGGTTEVYLTHSAMVEKLVSGAGSKDTDQSVWVPADSDPEVEAVMLQRLMAFMGASDRKAARTAATSADSGERLSSLNTGGAVPTLDVRTDYARAWRLVGIAMNRVGFTVEDRNRSAGDYFVRYNDPDDERYTSNKSGWLSKLAFWSDGDSKRPEGGVTYIIHLAEESDELSRVTVRDDSGASVSSNTATRILSLLHAQLR
jgi:outer membrane protein assembly factor BamC